MKNKTKTVAFDADVTLWANQPFYDEAEEEFFRLFANDLIKGTISEELFKTKMNNIQSYGYGAKASTLSMIETAEKIIEIGKQLIEMPINILPEVKHPLESLSGRYRLVPATKGNLPEQERKLKKSGLSDFFQKTEIMSDKKEVNYKKLFEDIDSNPENFLMIDNSLKSDIVPVLLLGGAGAYVHFYVTWEHEKYNGEIEDENFIELKRIDEISNYLR